MRVATITEMKELEGRVIDAGASADVLMESAAEGMRKVLLEDPLTRNSREVLILAGKGNNGGDGIVLGRLLLEEGWKVSLFLASDSQGELSNSKLLGLKKKFPEVVLHTEIDQIVWPKASGIVIDALLGIGSEPNSKPKGKVAEVIARANEERWGRSFRTVALDLPSGLSEGTTEVHDSMVVDLTITVGFPKSLLLEERLSNWVGRIEVVPLFESEAESLSEHRELIVRSDLDRLLPRRWAHSYKGSYGKGLIMAGSPGMTGAAVLAASACLRAGAGLTYLSTFTDCVPLLSGMMPPEVMVRDIFSGELFQLFQTCNAIAIGPGLGQTQEALSAVSYLFDHARDPVVIDADGLTLLALNPNLEAMIPEGSILTPHEGEMSRLLKAEIVDRERQALEYARAKKVIVILKGTRTIVAHPDGRVRLNSTGNPGMAKGGSGDVLTGILTALLAQGLSPWDAACLGVWLHGRAADEALSRLGVEESIVAMDLIESLSSAIQSLRG